MRKNWVFFVLTFTLLLMTQSPAVAFAPNGVEDIEVPRLRTPVTLDGAIAADEWSDAAEIQVIFRFFNATWAVVENRTGYIYLKHDCKNLWTCIQIENPFENVTIWSGYPGGMPTVMGDCVWVFYDVSGDMTIGAGDDEKGVLHPSFTYDGAIIPEPPGYDQDTNLGGTKDIDGASGWSGGWLTVEMVHPLNSARHEDEC